MTDNFSKLITWNILKFIFYLQSHWLVRMFMIQYIAWNWMTSVKLKCTWCSFQNCNICYFRCPVTHELFLVLLLFYILNKKKVLKIFDLHNLWCPEQDFTIFQNVWSGWSIFCGFARTKTNGQNSVKSYI